MSLLFFQGGANQGEGFLRISDNPADLTPSPEPGTMVLLVVGLGTLGMSRNRLQKLWR